MAVCPTGDSLRAQADTAGVMIAGTVIDPQGNPLEGVDVRILGDSLGRLTSRAGTFRLFAHRGETILQLRRPGYKAQLLRVDGEWSGRVLMVPGAFELPAISVTGHDAKPAKYASTSKYDDYFRRRWLGFGEFLSREDIERRAPLHTYQIFEARAGIKVLTPGNLDAIVSFSRCREYPPKINVYLDGRKLIAAAASKAALIGTESPMKRSPRDPEILAMVGEVLQRVNPLEIELIEIFRGPGELPAEFSDGNCGAIAIWTR